MNKIKNIFLFLLALILAAAAFYFFYYQKTPEYSMIMIQQAFKNRDLPTFEKHVDIDRVLDNLFDEVVEAQAESMEFEEQQMVTNLAKLFKKPFVKAAKDNLLKRFEEKEPSTPQIQEISKESKPAGDSKPEKKDTKNIFKNLAQRLKPNKMEYKGTRNARTEGNIAYADVVLYDTKLEKDYTFTAQMVRLEDRTWQLVKFKNVNLYLRDLLDDKISSER